MPKKSERGRLLTQSPIRSLIPFARKAKAQGKEVIHLNIGQPDIETPAEALEAIRNIDNGIISYGPSEGLPSLRKIVATYLNGFEAEVTMEDVFVTTGASEAIIFTLFSCCDYGDEVIIPEPFYANYLGFAEQASVEIVPVTTFIEDGFQLPDASHFEKLITPKTKAIFLCNPGNPTGQLYSKEDLKQIVDLALQHNLFLIVDEVYREFCYDRPFTSVLSFQEAKENVIVIDSISKVFSSCGARVGCLITKNAGVKISVVKYAQLRLCPPYIGQVLAEACFNYGDEYIQKSKEEYLKRRTVLYNRLNAIEGINAYLPTAAFYNIINLPFDDVTPFCKWLLTDFDIDNTTIMLAPADGFYFNQELGKSQVRIAYIVNEEKLNKSMDILEAAIPVYQKLIAKVVV